MLHETSSHCTPVAQDKTQIPEYKHQKIILKMQKTFVFNEQVSLNGYSVIFPSVCVGNVAQLAVDLLISSLEMRKVATVWHPAIIPVLGPRAYEHQTVSDASSASNNITTACELFIDETKRLACFQLRSPLDTKIQMSAFFDELVTFLKEQQVQKIIILTGMFSYEQHAIEETKFMYLANEQYQAQNSAQLGNSQWAKWNESNGIINGGGFALQLYKRIGDTIPSCLFFKYTAEGDNRSDAIEMIQRLNVLLNSVLPPSSNDAGFKMVVPISWKAMYGNAPTQQLY